MLPTYWVPPTDDSGGQWGMVEEHLEMVANGEAVLPLGNLFFCYAREMNRTRFARMMRGTGNTYNYVIWAVHVSESIELHISNCFSWTLTWATTLLGTLPGSMTGRWERSWHSRLACGRAATTGAVCSWNHNRTGSSRGYRIAHHCFGPHGSFLSTHFSSLMPLMRPPSA